MSLLNKLIVATLPLVPKPVVRRFASRYIAGEEISDAVALVKTLNRHSILATLDVLGEDIHHKDEAAAARDTIIKVLDAIQKEKLDSNISVKLTQIGLKLDRRFCLENMQQIVCRAKDLNNFIRIDMEDSSTTDDTIWLYRELRKDFSNVGIVLQAYLRRTYDDAEKMIKDGLTNFRLCKGIYIEPAEIAYKDRRQINDNFKRVLEMMLRHKAYAGIATHDSELIDASYRMIDEMKLGKREYEFQMLLGVRPDLRAKILRNEHHLRVYVPFGKQWYQYSIRRFKENPQVAGYVFKALFSRNRLN
ncbi:MAG: proline dehydrogenase family protein [Ignavibacteriae bacterium]|nr:proline dehydrogenase family protein [Ignavibacteria bacterium]MBI3365182.1 proline dehydrogenase family protein [Ignavibacteriota bacterium]